MSTPWTSAIIESDLSTSVTLWFGLSSNRTGPDVQQAIRSAERILRADLRTRVRKTYHLCVQHVCGLQSV